MRGYSQLKSFINLTCNGYLGTVLQPHMVDDIRAQVQDHADQLFMDGKLRYKIIVECMSYGNNIEVRILEPDGGDIGHTDAMQAVLSNLDMRGY